MIHHGDLFDVLPTLEADSIDACVTDPPYGIGFMGKEWDTFKPEVSQRLRERGESWVARRPDNPNINGRKRQPGVSPSAVKYDRSLSGQRQFSEWCERWAREVFRVLKPGGHFLICGAPRSFHRMTVGVEDAGFEIRDCLSWIYGQGFPKSLNLPGGLGTALKPGWEPIILARKPTAGTVAANVAAHGTGALNIDACRIAGPPSVGGSTGDAMGYQRDVDYANRLRVIDRSMAEGRWPANVLLDEDAAAALDEQTGEVGGGYGYYGNRSGDGATSFAMSGKGQRVGFDDIGGASRFFYVAKPSREERDYGCDGIKARTGGEATDRQDGTAGLNSPRAGAGRNGGSRNVHPTVKPIALMRYLVKLITPPGGTVLDPFTGSGTTGMACRYEHREFIGIEREAEYIAIAEARIAAVAPLFAVSSS